MKMRKNPVSYYYFFLFSFLCERLLLCFQFLFPPFFSTVGLILPVTPTDTKRKFHQLWKHRFSSPTLIKYRSWSYNFWSCVRPIPHLRRSFWMRLSPLLLSFPFDKCSFFSPSPSPHSACGCRQTLPGRKEEEGERGGFWLDLGRRGEEGPKRGGRALFSGALSTCLWCVGV